MKLRFLLASAVAALIVAVIACGGTTTPTSATTPAIQTNGTSTPTPSGTGTLRVTVKDTPFSDAKAVLVTFSGVSVHASGGGWKTVPFADSATSRTCDLKQLQSATDILGVTSLDAGHYTQVRLIVSSAALYFTNPAATGPCAATIAAPAGDFANLTIPPGDIILNRPFDLAAAGAVTMLLDFDGDKSIIRTGNGAYKMQPVINIVSVQ